MFHNSGYKRALCGSQWDPVLGITGEYNAFNDLGNSKASHGCCPAGKYMSSPFLTFSETNSCTRCLEGTYTSVPNDDTSCSICPEGKTNNLGSAGISSCHLLTSISLCKWTDIAGEEIAAGTFSVPAPGCKMKKIIIIKVDVTIEGEIGSYHELQSNRVDNLDVPASSAHRHFLLESPGKLTLNDLKLTWGEAGGNFNSGWGQTAATFSGGFIKMNDGILAINFVRFDGSKTTGTHALWGGCIYVMDGEVTIQDSTFEGFRAGSGGAMRVAKTSTPMTIKSTTFRNNGVVVRFFFLSFLFCDMCIN